mmetsp:Transcript_1939/g.4029  ORF Transcript_1939/g.4029 Transcript_1939/m.4029 type:complete len:392 (+) Transcript_1939:297-1472(+)
MNLSPPAWATNLTRKARLISASLIFTCYALHRSAKAHQSDYQDEIFFNTSHLKNLRETAVREIPVDPTNIQTTNAPHNRVKEEPAIKILRSPNEQLRKNCQIVYIIAVEGAAHHGFQPVVEALARNQKDVATGKPYDVQYKSKEIQRALFGLFGGFKRGDMDDPKVISDTISTLCPDDGRKHVIIEDSSFPSRHADDRRTYRVKRQVEWAYLSMQEIAESETALNHPFNLSRFYETYSPYADIKFVVLHRPYLETIASHTEWDEGIEGHSNVIRGFMLLLRRFLDSNILDDRTGRKVWTLICIERIVSKTYEFDNDKVKQARKRLISHLARFLAWPRTDCPHCFDTWKDSTKDYNEVLGGETVAVLKEHMQQLEGIWPPVGNNAAWQQCSV